MFRSQLTSNKIASECLVFLFALAGPAMLQAQLTTININNQVIQSPVKRFGVNLGATNYYDSGQMLKNLIVNNPGFEGEIAQSMIQCGSGTASSCTHSTANSAWPDHFWDGATYQFVYGTALGRSGTISSFAGADGNGYGVFNFADSGTAPAKGDYMIVSKPVPGNAADGWTVSTGGYDPNGVIPSPSVSTNSTDLPPGTQGIQTAYFSALEQYWFAQATASFDSTANHTFLQLNGQYQLTFRAKGLGSGALVNVQLFRNTNPQLVYISQSVPLTNGDSSGWGTYTLPFTASENGLVVGTAQLIISTDTSNGPDSFYIDDINLSQVNGDPTNNTIFRDPVVNALKQLNPGVIRFWYYQLGETLDNMLAPPLGRQRSTYSSFSDDTNFVEYGLTDFLQLCQTVGADPWVVIPITLSDAEASNLIDYLAGPTSTVYGAKRAAAGQTAPWTSVFKTIHLEFGNEAWDTIFDGGNMVNGQAYGTRAQAVFADMRNNSNYNAASFDLIINGWAGVPSTNTVIQSFCKNNDSFADAPYLMYTVNDPAASGLTGAAATEDLFGSMFAEAEAFVTDSGTAQGVADGLILQNQLSVQNSGNPKPYITTEFNITPRAGSITQAEMSGFASSVGAGLAVADGMLQQLRVGVLTQNLFQLAQYDYITTNSNGQNITADLFGSVVDMGVTDLRRPQFVAEEMVNNAIGTNSAIMLQTVHSGANPTWNQAELQDSVQFNNAHYLQSFAFNNGGQYSLIVFNTNRTTALPVAFGGENVPAGTVQIQQLTSANITDTNENGLVVTPASNVISNFNAATPLSLPPFSMTILTWNAPQISNVAVSAITGTSATISWSTDVSASGLVNYGTTSSYGSQSASNAASTTQSVTLTGLTAGQTYDFAVSATNAAGATASSPNATFTTPGLFTISAPTTITLMQGEGNSFPITVTPTNGFSGTVTLSLSGLPTGSTDTFTATSTGATVAIQLPATATVGTYPLTLSGTTAGASAITVPMSLVVTQSQAITFDACAVDYGSCTIPDGATALVYYGANGVYLSKILSGTFSCSPTTFGSDPVHNVQKSCYPVVQTLPAGLTACAVDYGSCTIPSGTTATVFYGANSVYVYKSLSGTFSCAPSTFGGDPVPGVLKSCYPVTSASTLKSQTITFGTIAAQTVGTPLALTATASSGLAVSYASSTTSVCTVSGSTSTFLAAGTCTITASQAGNSTYAAATPVTQSFTVNAAALKSQTITFGTIGTQTVGAPLTLTATASSGLAVSYASSTTSICTVSGSTATFLTAGTCTITASQAGNSTYAAATPVSQSFTVNAATLNSQTITFGTIATQTVGTPLTLTATASSGLAVTYASSTTSICTVSGSTATFLAAGTCTLTASQAGNASYAAATPVSQSFTVQPAATSTTTIVSLGSAANVYGIFNNGSTVTNGGLDTSSYAYSANLLGTNLTFQGIPYSFGTAGSANAATSDTLALPAGSYSTLNFLGTATYGNQSSQSFTVTYTDGTTSTFTQSMSDWGTPQSYAGETIASTMSYRLSPNGSPTSGSSWYLYSYSFALNSAKTVKSFTLPNSRKVTVLAVTLASSASQAAQTITFGPIAAQTVGTPLTLTATASSSLAVSYASSTTSICTVSGSTATFLAAGTCTITASQAGNSTYAAATPVSQSFTVNAAALKSQTITFGTIAAPTVGTPLTLTASATSGLAVSYASSTTSICTVSGSTATFLAAGTCTITASQSGNATYAAATPVSQSFTVNAAALKSQTITFGTIAAQTVGTPLTLTATASSGLAVSYASSTTSICTVSGSTATFLAAGTCTITASQSGNATYSAATPVSQSFTVKAAALKSQTITFGTIAAQSVGTSLTLTATASSGLAVSYASSTTGICTVSGSTATLLAAGTCSITASQAGNSTYAAAPSVSQSFTVAAASTSSAMRFIPITPFRAVDTRNSTILSGGTSRSFTIAGSGGVPTTALAYSLNVTVVPSGTLSSLTVYPTGGSQPAFPLMSSDGRTKAQAAIIQAGTGGALTVAAANTTQVIIDVNGYFVPASNSSGLAFYPVTPTRLFDTRSSTGLTAGQTKTFAIQSTAGIPATAQAYSLNITAIPSGNLGDIIVWPAGQTQPPVSTLNTATNITANAAIVGAGTNGSISVYSTGSTNLLIDINGYWAPAGSGGLSLYPVTPVRTYTSGTTDVSGTVVIPAPSASTGIPGSVNALLLNATVTPSAGLGYLELWAAKATQPSVSTLNANDGSVTSNLAIVGTSSGSVDAYAQNPTLLTLDVYGYFAP